MTFADEPSGSQPEVNAPPVLATPHTKTPPSWSWVPVRSLGQRHRSRIASHLLSLDVNDRYLRFGYAATDSQISKYVDMLDFEHDEVFGIFSRRLELVAMAHLAHPSATSIAGRPLVSEFGVTVLKPARQRGFGRRLFERAMLHARNRGVQTLFIHALSENFAMLRIARSAGATVERSGSESDAWLKLPPDTLASHMDEIVEKHAAELDYQLKVQTHKFDSLVDVIAEVKNSLKKSNSIASE